MLNIIRVEEITDTGYIAGVINDECEPATLTMTKTFKDFNHSMVGMMLSHAGFPFHYGIINEVEANNGSAYQADFKVFSNIGLLYLFLHEESPEVIHIYETQEDMWVNVPDVYLFDKYNSPIHKIDIGISPTKLHQNIQSLIQSIEPMANILSLKDCRKKSTNYFEKLKYYRGSN